MRPVNPYFRKKHGRKPPHLKNRHEEAKNQTGNRAERLVEYARNPNERNDTSWNVLKWNGPALHSSGRRPPSGRGTRNWSAVSHRSSFGRRFARCVGEKQDEAGRETTLPLRTGAAVYERRAAERTEGTLGFWWCGRYGMHRWAMPIAPIDVDLAKYAHVTIVSPIWVFALAAPMRAFCGEAAGKIRTADYILVHHTRGQYENAAREMDALLGIHHTALRSVQCKVGRYREIPTNSRCGGSNQRL